MLIASHYDPWWLVLFQAILVLGFLAFLCDTLLDFISSIVRGVILIGKVVRGDVTYQGFDGYSGAERPSQARRGVPVDA